MTQRSPDAELRSDPSGRARDLVEEHLHGAGGTADEVLLAAHPELREELVEELRRRRLIQRAQQAADASSMSSEGDDAHNSLGVRCPHCYELFQVRDDDPLSSVGCPTCGESFLFVGHAKSKGEGPRTSIGPFMLLDKLGEGGFGAVWKARDTRLDRLVAVKMPHASRMSRGDVELFLREARTAAQLRHPRIVAVHEVGRDGDLTYIVTDLVDGEPLSDRIRRERFSAREAAVICAEMARALDHAHSHGVVHRDLKPANVLLDADGHPKLTDFGLARRQADDVTLTVTGQVLGTPAYMSPEQAAGGSHQADARSDIYSLGVILFELLTGELPFRGSLRAMLDQVLESEPPTPRRFNRSLPRDLETICLKCLEKQPSRRYATALALADDLERFLRGEPILARPVHRVERAWRWMRRNPLLSALALLVLVLAIVGPLVAVRQTRLAAREHAALDALSRSQQDLRRSVYIARMNTAQQAAIDQDFVRAEVVLSSLVPQRGETDLRGFEWHYWHGVCSRGLEQVIPTKRPIHPVAASPDESLLAFGGYEFDATLWDLRQGRALHRLGGHSDAIKALAFSPDGRWLATAGNDHRVIIWNTADGSLLRKIERYSLPVRGVRFTPNGNVISASMDGQLLELNPVSGELVREWPVTCKMLTSLEVAPDGASLAVAGGDPVNDDPQGDTNGGDVVVWDYPSGRQRFRVHGAEIDPTGLSYSPDSHWVAVGGRSGAPFLFDAASGEPGAACDPQISSVHATTFSADGATLFAAGKRGLIWGWEVSSGHLRETLSGHGGLCLGMSRFPKSGRLATAGLDSSVRIWRLEGPPPMELLDGHVKNLAVLQRTLDSRRWLTSGPRDEQATAILWRVDDQRVLHVERMLDCAALAMHPSDGSLILARETGRLDVDRDGKRELLYSCAPDDRVHWGRFSRDGKTLAVACYSSTPDKIPGEPCRIFLWDWPSRTLRHSLSANRRRISQMSFSPNGRQLATAGYDRTVMVLDCDRGVVEHTINLDREINQVLSSVAYSPDGSQLAAAGNGRIWIWDARTHELLRRLTSSSGALYSIGYTPDGRTLAVAQSSVSTAEQGEIAFWDTASWEIKSTLATPRPVGRLAFDPAGKMLLAGDFSGQLLVWRSR